MCLMVTMVPYLHMDRHPVVKPTQWRYVLVNLPVTVPFNIITANSCSKFKTQPIVAAYAAISLGLLQC